MFKAAFFQKAGQVGYKKLISHFWGLKPYKVPPMTLQNDVNMFKISIFCVFVCQQIISEMKKTIKELKIWFWRFSTEITIFFFHFSPKKNFPHTSNWAFKKSFIPLLSKLFYPGVPMTCNKKTLEGLKIILLTIIA